jgi:hypothetical protein
VFLNRGFRVVTMRSLLCACTSIFEVAGCSACCVALRVFLANETAKSFDNIRY